MSTRQATVMVGTFKMDDFALVHVLWQRAGVFMRPSDGRAETLRKVERDPDSGLLTEVFLEIRLPESFPERYKEAVVRAAELCIIRRHMNEPPIFHVTANIG